MRARCSGGMPIPVSETRTTTSSSFDSPDTSTRPPCGVYLTAFSTRLANMEVSWVSSPRTAYRAALPLRFHERTMFLRRAAGRSRASTTMRMLRTSTGWGFRTPSSLSRRARSNRSVMSWANRSVSLLSWWAKKRACSGSSSSISERLSARSLRLVAGVLSSWDTLATKSRRILLTRLSSARLTVPPAPGRSPPRPSGSSAFLSSVTLPPPVPRRSHGRGGHRRHRLEAVAQAPNGVDVLVLALPCKRGPDAPHVHVYGARGAHARVAPDLLGQVLPALELAGTGGQRRQQLELLQAQVQGLAPDAGREVLRVQPQVAGFQDLAARPRRGGAALEVRVDPRHQLLHAEGLGHVVVRPGLEALDLVLLGVLGGDHDDHDLPVALPQPLAQPDAGLARKHHVEQDEVGPQPARQLRGLRPVQGLVRAEALPAQVVREGVEDHRVVLDDQDLRRGLYAQSTPTPVSPATTRIIAYPLRRSRRPFRRG